MSIQPIVSRKVIWLVTLGWLVALLLGFTWLYQYSMAEQKRDEQSWQRQLRLTATSQARQIEQWLEAEQSVVAGLANNTSLKLYLTELGNRSDLLADDQAFSTFLRNLLISEAQQHGFTEPNMSEAINANMPVPVGSGIAILDKRFAPVVNTASMPMLKDLPKDIRDALKAKNASPIGPFLLNDKTYLLFTAPIHGIQSSKVVHGYIVAVKSIEGDLAELLSLPPGATESSESFLIRKQGNSVEYINTLADGTKPLTLKLDISTDDLLGTEALKGEKNYVSDKVDYRGTKVLASSQPINGTSWTLVHKINQTEAFAATNDRRQSLLSGYILLTGLITMTLVAVWRSVSAQRAREAAQHYEQFSLATEKQKSLLSHLANTLIMLVDSRDPHAQNHSNHVAMVASAIAEEMELPASVKETTSLAASLMNVGKIKLPANLLSEKEISDESKDQIRQSMLDSADLLKDIEFDGPVVGTLRQVQEHVDGTGPLGLKEDEIILPAQIIAVANAFVAMVSKRSYREALSIDAALDEMHKQVDKTYSRKAVAALEHYLENGGGRETWERVVKAA